MRRSRYHTQKTADHAQITDAISIREHPVEVEERARQGVALPALMAMTERRAVSSVMDRAIPGEMGIR